MKIERLRYIRKVERVGTLSVFFEVKIKNKNEGYNYHFCYSDNEDINKANFPLDLAICPSKSQIEYISFFIENEKLLKEKLKNKIIYTNDSILITDQEFTFDKRYIDEVMEFDQYIQDKDIYVISKTANIDLIGYRLDDDHYILFDEEDKFSGVVFKNLTDIQMNELKKSNVL